MFFADNPSHIAKTARIIGIMPKIRAPIKPNCTLFPYTYAENP